MAKKRIIIATLLGLLFGLFCAYGTESSMPGVFSTGILASIVYNRVLIGFFIGIADSIKISPIIRGAKIGAIIGLAIAIPSGWQGGTILLAFSIIYGILIDVITSRIVQGSSQ
ncbi:MAG: hypothetical protein FJY77_02785 [Candidatus Altiarchaeales archaeon]|nr:hypothetical protein [Candidatus Altiarchaeales archaeon]